MQKIIILLLIAVLSFAASAQNPTQKSSQADAKPAGHIHPLTAVAFSIDGKRALTGSYDGIRLWDIDSGKEILHFGYNSEIVYSLAFSPDGRRALSGGEEIFQSGYAIVYLWDLTNGKELLRIKLQQRSVRAVAFSPDGSRAFFNCRRYGSSGSFNAVCIWDLKNGREISHYTGVGLFPSSQSFSPDGNRVLLASDNSFILLDLKTGIVIQRFIGSAYEVALSPNGHYALSASGSEPIRLWDVESGKEIRSFSGYTYPRQVAFSPDGHLALACGGGEDTQEAGPVFHPIPTRIWDVKSGDEIRRFIDHRLTLNAAFSPDSRFVLSGGSEGIIGVWDIDSGREIRHFVVAPADLKFH